jgi:hypothetical protein
MREAQRGNAPMITFSYEDLEHLFVISQEHEQGLREAFQGALISNVHAT